MRELYWSRSVMHMLPADTHRLRFREMTDADLADIATLELGGGADPAHWIAWNRRSYADRGYGLWIIETHAGEFVGDCGLTMQEVEGERLLEAGWHVRSSHRRQGYAAEAAAAVREVARIAGTGHLIAIIRPHNVASQRVAARIGMTLEREIDKNGRPALVFGADLTR
jgi:RimJ/RimL family protein N-acetyltransferase